MRSLSQCYAYTQVYQVKAITKAKTMEKTEMYCGDEATRAMAIRLYAQVAMVMTQSCVMSDTPEG